jgi:hypothetical protein
MGDHIRGRLDTRPGTRVRSVRLRSRGYRARQHTVAVAAAPAFCIGSALPHTQRVWPYTPYRATMNSCKQFDYAEVAAVYGLSQRPRARVKDHNRRRDRRSLFGYPFPEIDCGLSRCAPMSIPSALRTPPNVSAAVGANAAHPTYPSGRTNAIRLDRACHW